MRENGLLLSNSVRKTNSKKVVICKIPFTAQNPEGLLEALSRF